MLVDSRALSVDEIIETEICIIGGGAAGITIAREFINQPYQVCILESGGLNFEADTQSLYQGDNVGVPYFPLKESRARFLGGSTNLWGGWSRPLDEIDFEDRPWMPHSGWPFTKAALDPYYERAQKACQLGPFQYDFSDWKDALAQLNRQQLPFSGDQIETYVWQTIPQAYWRFGEVYRPELEQAKNINIYLHANVVEIETNDTAQAATRLRVASLDGKKFWVSAKVFILAVGGIENPRLLLASNKVQNTGLGNQHDLVGRFFMEHPYLISGTVQLSNPAALYIQRKIQVGETLLTAGLGLSKETQKREQLLNFSARLIPIIPDWVAAVNRLRHKFRKLEELAKAFPTIREGCSDKLQKPVAEDLSTIIANLDSVAARTYAKLFDKSFYSRQSNFCNTMLIGEQAPNPDSRVKLSSERDRLGVNLVDLDWRLTELDKYTITRSQQIIAAQFESSGLGQVQIELNDNDSDWQKVQGSYHHIGTTRMSTNPRLGVVDEDCQVHGISNLYVTGSSVFPTSGLSNPTLTIVALAIRLADHLKMQMGATAEAIRAPEITYTKPKAELTPVLASSLDPLLPTPQPL